MFFLLTRLSQAINNISQNMQRSINIASFPQPLPLYVGMFNSLTTCQIYHMKFGLPASNGLILHNFALYQDTENRMRAGTLAVHEREGRFSIFFTLKQQRHGAAVVQHFSLN